MAKKVRIRRAKPGDRNLFKKLWGEYLEEQLKAGSDVACTDKNLETFCQVFDAYTSERVTGVVLFVAEDAVLMWGAPMAPSGLDCVHGDKIAQGWGVYVKDSRRRDGVASALYTKGFNILKNLGFKHLVGSVIAGNIPSIENIKKHGCVFSHHIVFKDLHKDS